jgi:hypothetical protein
MMTEKHIETSSSKNAVNSRTEDTWTRSQVIDRTSRLQDHSKTKSAFIEYLKARS